MTMRMLMTICMITLLTACTSVSNVSYQLADGTFHNQRTVSDPHAFAPTAQRSWLEICQPKLKAGKLIEHEKVSEYVLTEMLPEPDYTNCTAVADPRYATTSGWADGIGSAVVHGGAFVGGMYLLGQGIADSGSVTNQTQAGGGANQTQNTSATAFQNQGQSQAGYNGHGRR